MDQNLTPVPLISLNLIVNIFSTGEKFVYVHVVLYNIEVFSTMVPNLHLLFIDKA